MTISSRRSCDAALSGAALLLLAACGPPPQPPDEAPPPYKRVPEAVLLTSGVRIDEVNGQWMLPPNQRFAAPFTGDGCFRLEGDEVSPEIETRLEAGRASARQLHSLAREIRSGAAQKEGDPGMLTDAKIREALVLGARPVWVHVENLPRPLYGILFLGQVMADSPASVASAYHIEIPSERVEGARGGRISAVWEQFSAKGWRTHWLNEIDNEWRANQATFDCASWILWISDLPLPGVEWPAVPEPAGPSAQTGAAREQPAPAPPAPRPGVVPGSE